MICAHGVITFSTRTLSVCKDRQRVRKIHVSDLIIPKIVLHALMSSTGQIKQKSERVLCSMHAGCLEMLLAQPWQAALSFIILTLIADAAQGQLIGRGGGSSMSSVLPPRE